MADYTKTQVLSLFKAKVDKVGSCDIEFTPSTKGFILNPGAARVRVTLYKDGTQYTLAKEVVP